MAIETSNIGALPADASPSLTKAEKRAMQARINGAKSKGPVTPEGLAKSSKNAIRHGLTANEHTLLETEFADEYEEVYNAFIADLRPATKAELRLVEKIANIDWRAERLVMMETCIFNMEAGLSATQILERFSRIDGIGIIVDAWKQSTSAAHCLDLLRRYMGTLQHQFNTMLSNFYKLEARRIARVRGGTNLDEEWGPPYERPRFETHLSSQTEAAAAGVAVPEVQEKDEPAAHTAKAIPFSRSFRPKQNEPGAPTSLADLQRRMKRPAA